MRQLCPSGVESTEPVYLVTRVARIEMLEALYDFDDMLSSWKSLSEVPEELHMYVYLCQNGRPCKLLELIGFSVHHSCIPYGLSLRAVTLDARRRSSNNQLACKCSIALPRQQVSSKAQSLTQAVFCGPEQVLLLAQPRRAPTNEHRADGRAVFRQSRLRLRVPTSRGNVCRWPVLR